MKTTVAIIAFVFTCITSYSQSIFEVKTLGNTYDQETIENAFESANFCGFFLLNERHEIVLTDGAVIELLSANESAHVTNECSREDDYEFPFAEWSISESGIIVRKLSYSPIK